MVWAGSQYLIRLTKLFALPVQRQQDTASEVLIRASIVRMKLTHRTVAGASQGSALTGSLYTCTPVDVNLAARYGTTSVFRTSNTKSQASDWMSKSKGNTWTNPRNEDLRRRKASTFVFCTCQTTAASTLLLSSTATPDLSSRRHSRTRHRIINLLNRSIIHSRPTLRFSSSAAELTKRRRTFCFETRNQHLFPLSPSIWPLSAGHVSIQPHLPSAPTTPTAHLSLSSILEDFSTSLTPAPNPRHVAALTLFSQPEIEQPGRSKTNFYFTGSPARSSTSTPPDASCGLHQSFASTSRCR